MSTPYRPLLRDYQHALIPACLLFMGGALLAYGFSPPLAFWGIWLGISIISTLSCLLYASHVKDARWFIWLTAFCLGGVYFSLFQFQPGPMDVSVWGHRPHVEVEGTIIGRGMSPNQWVLAVTSVQHQPANGHVLIKRFSSKASAKTPTIGSHLEIAGHLEIPPAATFPGGFSYRDYLYQHGISSVLTPIQWHITHPSPSLGWLPFLQWTDQLRERVSQHFQKHLPSPQAEIFASIFLGEHAIGMDPAVKKAFAQAGLIHVLAASGLNVGLIAFCFIFIGNQLKLPYKVALAIAMIGVAFYCLLTGLPPSVQRAGMMLELAFLLKLLNRELTALMLLCLTGALLIVLNPMIVTMLGFQLSFLSTFGIIAMVPPLQERWGFYLTHWGAGILLVPLVAQLWVTPILWLHFYQIQLLSLPANIMALPIVAILTYAGFILGGLSLFIPNLTGWMIEGLGFLSHFLYQIALFFSKLPFSVWMVSPPPLFMIILLTGALFLLTYLLHNPNHLPKPQWKWVISAMAFALLLPYSISKWQNYSFPSITWLPGNNGAGIEIVQASPNTVIVTASSLGTGIARDLTHYLRREGIHHIQVLHLTSPAIRAYQGLEEILSSIRTDHITLPAPLYSPKVQSSILQTAEKHHVPVIPLASTHRIATPKVIGTFYALPNHATWQRFDFGPTCYLSSHREVNAPPHPLQPLAQGCDALFTRIPGSSPQLTLQQKHYTFQGFHKLTLDPSQRRLTSTATIMAD